MEVTKDRQGHGAEEKAQSWERGRWVGGRLGTRQGWSEGARGEVPERGDRVAADTSRGHECHTKEFGIHPTGQWEVEVMLGGTGPLFS